MNQIFTNREIALGIWVIVFIISLLSIKSLRFSLGRVVNSFFAWKLVAINISATIYVAGVSYLLFSLNLWDVSQLKNTILWLLTVGFISLFGITDDNKSNYFKETVKDILKFTTILEFLVGLYSFNLSTELIIIPLIICLYALAIIGEKKEELKPVVKLLNGILTLFGFFILGYTTYRIIQDLPKLVNQGTLADFMTPASLSILFLPYLYILSLIVNRESVFIGIDRELKNEGLLSFTKWKTLIHFNFNKNDLLRWRRLIFALHPRTKKDILDSIFLIKRLKKVEKSPPDIPIQHGWSPYHAKDYLIKHGITTKYYQPIYKDEWEASSSSIDLKNSILSSNVIYTLKGMIP
jgi:hypothetical protein